MYITELPAVLRAEIDSAGVTIAEIGEMLDIPATRISCICCGTKPIRRDEIEAFCTIFPKIDRAEALGAVDAYWRNIEATDFAPMTNEELAKISAGPRAAQPKRILTSQMKLSAQLWWGRCLKLSYGESSVRWAKLCKSEKEGIYNAYILHLEVEDMERQKAADARRQKRGGQTILETWVNSPTPYAADSY